MTVREVGIDEGVWPESAAGPPSLGLSVELAETLISIAREALPNEACAILSGPGAGVALTVHPAQNAAGSPYRFEMDPSDLVRIVHAIEAAGDEIVSIFHSHPASPGIPSATDLRDARYDVVHLIADMRDPGAAAVSALHGWRIGPDGACSEVDIEVIG